MSDFHIYFIFGKYSWYKLKCAQSLSTKIMTLHTLYVKKAFYIAIFKNNKRAIISPKYAILRSKSKSKNEFIVSHSRCLLLVVFFIYC